MMPRKKKKIILIISIIVVLLIVAITMALLYISTDMFKAKSTLFAKYIGQNVENVNNMFAQNSNEQYKESLKQSKFTKETEIKANFTKDVGTTAENTENSINHLKLKIEGQTDKANNYNYQDITLLNDDEKSAEIEYIQNEEVYGLRFKDLFNQYVLTDKEDIKNTIQQVGVDKEQIEQLPENINIESKIKEIFQFSDEEKQSLSTKYSNIINKNVSKDNFSKQGNQTIQIDGKNIRANAYILTLNKEQLNNVYIKILEELKQEEIVLSRIDKIQELNSTNNASEGLKEQYIAKIDDVISDINKNNIGDEETKIIVYESNKTTVKTIIQGVGYEVDFEILSNQYMKLAFKNTGTEEQADIITYKKEGEKTSITFENQEGEKTKQYSIDIDEKIDKNTCNQTITASYDDTSNKFEITIEQKTNIVEEFEETVKLNNKNSINLSDLEDEQKETVTNEVITGVAEKVNDLTTNVINIQDISDILKTIGFIEEEITIEGGQVTDAQRNRFNSKFEMLQGTELEKEKTQELIDSTKENLSGYEVVSNTEIRLKIDQKNGNEEVSDTIKAFIEQNDNMKYNVKVEYDETTGLVNGLLLTLLKE